MVDCRPRIRLRCGNRPKRSMISRCSRDMRPSPGRPTGGGAPRSSSMPPLLVGKPLTVLERQIEEQPARRRARPCRSRGPMLAWLSPMPGRRWQRRGGAAEDIAGAPGRAALPGPARSRASLANARNHPRRRPRWARAKPRRNGLVEFGSAGETRSVDDGACQSLRAGQTKNRGTRAPGRAGPAPCIAATRSHRDYPAPPTANRGAAQSASILKIRDFSSTILIQSIR